MLNDFPAPYIYYNLKIWIIQFYTLLQNEICQQENSVKLTYSLVVMVGLGDCDGDWPAVQRLGNRHEISATVTTFRT